mgnify:CR=1 FL=1
MTKRKAEQTVEAVVEHETEAQQIAAITTEASGPEAEAEPAPPAPTDIDGAERKKESEVAKDKEEDREIEEAKPKGKGDGPKKAKGKAKGKAKAKGKGSGGLEKISLGENENLYITKEGETWYTGKDADGNPTNT